MRPSSTASVPTAAPEELRGWSLPDLLETFAAALPSWLHRFGVLNQHLEDAVQEALIELCEGADEIPRDPDEARRELLRRTARVALRARRDAQRRAQRCVLTNNVETLDPRDVEAWVEARVLILKALERLDKQTRALLIAHELEGRTNAEIAKKLGEKEATIENRVIRGRARLRAEVDRLLGKSKDKKHGAVVLLGAGLPGLDSLDRAILRAILEAEEGSFPHSPPPSSTTRPVAAGTGAGAGAGAFIGPLLAGLLALLGVGAILFALASRPKIPMDMGHALHGGPPITSISVRAVIAVAPTAGVASPARARPRPPRRAPPKSPVRSVSREELAARVADLKKPVKGIGP